VENAYLIQSIGRRLDKMHVGFWKVKGHSNDPWNDLADSLAVRGRNQSASEVTVQVLFRPTVDGEEKFWAIPRLSLNANANIHDFWIPLVDKFGRHGDPEDYEIWNGHTPLEGPLIHGLGYEIVPRSSPGRAKPATRRNSADFSVNAIDCSKPLIQFRSKEWSPRPLARTDEPAREVPPPNGESKWFIRQVTPRRRSGEAGLQRRTLSTLLRGVREHLSEFLEHGGAHHTGGIILASE
jgi:hypothetical protein